jgi:hypothetical protein
MDKIIITLGVIASVSVITLFVLIYSEGVKNDTKTLNVGNITGSGYPEEYVREHADQFPLSGLPESEKAKEAFIKSL